jgi:hypothetical protein
MVMKIDFMLDRLGKKVDFFCEALNNEIKGPHKLAAPNSEINSPNASARSMPLLKLGTIWHVTLFLQKRSSKDATNQK